MAGLWFQKKLKSKDLKKFQHGIKSMIFDDLWIIAMIVCKIKSLIFPDMK